MRKKQQLQLLLLCFFCCILSLVSSTKFVTLQLNRSSSRTTAISDADDDDHHHVDLANSFAVQLVHRAEVVQSENATTKQQLLWTLRRDVLRSKAISDRIKLATSNVSLDIVVHPASSSSTDSEKKASFQSPLISGVAGGSGDYFARIGVGTPARDVYMVADTGSDVSWLQCSPCRKCYRQQDPIFDPSLSSSFKKIPCESSICGRLKVKGCSSKNECLYQVSYGDGSFTVGDFSTETVTFGGNHTINDVPMGCGRNNQGLFHGAAGLLGLGRGPLSFPSETGETFGHSYSYCLPKRDSRTSASLIFGPAAVPAGAKFTNLVPNSRLSTYYYVNMAGIRVGGTSLKLPTDVFVLSSRGDGGVIVDSGTAITRLTTSAYSVLRDAFRKGVNNLPPASGISLFDTCFDLSAMNTVKMPAVDFVFDGGATMELPADNILVQVDDQGTYCFAFAPEDEAFSIIGNVQQQTFRMSFDNLKNVMGITPRQC